MSLHMLNEGVLKQNILGFKTKFILLEDYPTNNKTNKIQNKKPDCLTRQNKHNQIKATLPPLQQLSK